MLTLEYLIQRPKTATVIRLIGERDRLRQEALDKKLPHERTRKVVPPPICRSELQGLENQVDNLLLGRYVFFEVFETQIELPHYRLSPTGRELFEQMEALSNAKR